MRRCKDEQCKIIAHDASRLYHLDMPVVTILDNPKKEWNLISGGNRKFANNRKLSVDWSKFGTDDHLFTHCFIENTMILMSDGTEKPIQDICIGDEVITHLGRVKKVTNTMSRIIDEEILKINPSSLNSLFVTKEHPFSIIRKRDSYCKNNKHKKCIYGFGKNCIENKCNTNGVESQFVLAGNLSIGDRTFTPSLKERGEFGITKEQMRLLGYYVAEGRVDKDCRQGESDSVRFSISRNEKETLGVDICCLMKICFGINSHGEFGNKDSGGYTLSFASKEAAKWFLKHVGCGSKIKRLSKEVMYSSPEIQKELLFGWAKGDGEFNVNRRLLRISTSSSCLASQGEVLTDRIGGLAIIHKMRNCGGTKNRDKKGVIWHICIKHSNMGLLKDCFVPSCYSRWPRTGKRYRHASCVVSEISSIETLRYKGLVYNFSVEDDESYIANRCAVHNCTIVSSVNVADNGYYIEPNCNDLVNSNGNAWSDQVLLATFRTFVGGENYYEHVQVPALSKGKILDAVIRPVVFTGSNGKKSTVYYVDILVATSKKHNNLVGRIASGELQTLSMGCIANWVQCSKCGKQISDTMENCEHLDNEMNKTFVDENGVERIVAELCGRCIKQNGKLIGDPDSVEFIEASWVEHPAFQGAVLNHFVSDIDDKQASVLSASADNVLKMEDLFGGLSKIRVADVNGMLALRVAKEEIARKQKAQLVNNVTIWAKDNLYV